MGCFCRLCEEQTASWPTARANCALLKSRENLSMSRRSQNLCRFWAIFRNTVRCWRKNVPILSLCLSPIPPPFSFLLFHRSLPLSQSCSLPSLTAFFLAISFHAIAPSLSILCLCPPLPLSIFCFTALPISHECPCHIRQHWGHMPPGASWLAEVSKGPV